MSKVRAEVSITGNVQGVFFRQNTLEKARARNLCGWVRNNHDGSVSAVFEGQQDDIQTLISWCHEGPSSAEVSHVEVTWGSVTGEFHSFTIR